MNPRHVTGAIAEAAIDKASEELAALTAEELDEVEKTIRGFTTTNCWWAEYRMRDLMLSLINHERHQRDKAAADAEKGA